MKLLILSEASKSRDKHGLRAALSEQFCEHRDAVQWLEPGQLLPEFILTDEPTLVIDCLGADGNPCSARLPEELFARLIAHCNDNDWIWLLLSDSRVFSPLQKRRFVEADVPAPVLPVGRQLLTRETYIADRIDRYIVLRVGPIIASHGDNLLTHLLQQLRTDGPVVVPDMQRFCPTPAADVARVIAAIQVQLDCGAVGWGTYHYESADPVTSYEFAEVVLAAAAQYWQVAGNSMSVRSVAADNAADIFPLLNCQRIRDTFGIQQLPWRKAIPNFLKQIYANNSSEAKSS